MQVGVLLGVQGGRRGVAGVSRGGVKAAGGAETCGAEGVEVTAGTATRTALLKPQGPSTAKQQRIFAWCGARKLNCRNAKL